jgi:importin-4
MNQITSFDEVDLRGSITDTLGTIAGAVGREHFEPYLRQSVSVAMEGMKSDFSRLRESGFCFFAVLASVLKSDMTQLVPDIMLAINRTLKQEDLDFGEKGNGPVVVEEDEDTDEEDDVSLELNVNSAIQLEKEIAADAVGELFLNVGEGFLPYLDETAERLAELTETFYEGARKAALGSLWKFVITLGEIMVTEPWEPGLPVVFPILECWLSVENTVPGETGEVDCPRSREEHGSLEGGR